MSSQEILDAIPHRDPFLLVDAIIERGEKKIVCEKTFQPDDWFFAGHYPGYPLVPGVLLCEAAMQCGAILLSKLLGEKGLEIRDWGFEEGQGKAKESNPQSPIPNPLPNSFSALPKDAARIPVATRMNDVRFKRMVRPGEKLTLEVELVERLADAFFMKAKVTVDGRVAVRFEFACTAAKQQAT